MIVSLRAGISQDTVATIKWIDAVYIVKELFPESCPCSIEGLEDMELH